MTNHQCLKCRQYAAEKYWEEAYGVIKYYKCNNCGHSWRAGPKNVPARLKPNVGEVGGRHSD